MDDETAAPLARAALLNSVLGPYVAHYCCYLRDRRYAAQTRHIYLGCVAHFARWLAAEGLSLEDANEQAGRRFVSAHLPLCDCLPPVRRKPHEVRAALSHLHRVPGAVGHARHRRPATPGPSRRNWRRSIVTWARCAVSLPARAASASASSARSWPGVSGAARSRLRSSPRLT